MLQFNPYFRPTASELLKNPIFDGIRIKDNETKAPFKIAMNLKVNSKSKTQDGDVIRNLKMDVLKEIYKNKKFKSA